MYGMPKHRYKPNAKRIRSSSPNRIHNLEDPCPGWVKKTKGKCGSRDCITGPGEGRYWARIICLDCGKGRGWLTADEYREWVKVEENKA